MQILNQREYNDTKKYKRMCSKCGSKLRLRITSSERNLCLCRTPNFLSRCFLRFDKNAILTLAAGAHTHTHTHNASTIFFSFHFAHVTSKYCRFCIFRLLFYSRVDANNIISAQAMRKCGCRERRDADLNRWKFVVYNEFCGIWRTTL